MFFLKVQIHASRVEYVVLTGGSSLWPFVVDALNKYLGVPPDRVLKARNPQMTVAMGVSVLPSLKRHLTEKKIKLQADKPGFTRKLADRLSELVHQTASRIGNEAGSQLCEQYIDPELRGLRDSQELWTLRDFRKRLERACRAFEPAMNRIVQQQLAVFQEECVQLMRAELGEWLGTHDVKWSTAGGLDQPVSGVPVEMPDVSRADADTITIAVGLVSGATTALIAANLLGGAGIALLMSGPIGWFVGLVIGAAIAATVFIWGKDAAKEAVELTPIPALARTLILPNSSKELQKQVQSSMTQQIEQRFTEHRPQLEHEIDRAIQGVVDELGWVNLL